ncbi:hypothetical protein ACHAW6_007493 [Cyclotella cf. meneghiniana]
MVAEVTDSNDSATVPSVAVVPPSPVVTPTRGGGSKKKSGSAKHRRKRISPEESNGSSAAISHDLFGDFMSIEEIAAQTEKAYQSRKLNTVHKIPCPSSPSRLFIPEIPKRSNAKKSASTNKLPSTKKTYIFVALATALPFLLCESFLLVLTLRYRDRSVSEINSPAVDSESLRHLNLDNMDRRGDSAHVIDLVGVDQYVEKECGPVVNDTNEFSSMKHETQNAINECSIINQSTSSDCRDIKSSSNEKHEQKSDEPAAGVSKRAPLELETIQQINETHAFGILEYEAMLDEAFSMIAASKSTSANQKETENLHNAETLCENVRSRVREVSALKNDHSFGVGMVNKSFESGSSSSSYNANALRLLEYNSQLCIGGVKMSRTSSEVDTMLQEAKNTFEQLVHLDPYNLDAHAGLGSSVLAQGLLNSYPSSAASQEAQVSLLKLATFHLKLASSLCSASRGRVGRVLNELLISDEVPAEDAIIKGKEIERDKQLSLLTHVSVLHNLALAYVALGDSNSSVTLLLRAAAIQHNVLQLMEEKACLIGAKSERKKQKKKRRIPFVPETCTFDEMLDGI